MVKLIVTDRRGKPQKYVEVIAKKSAGGVSFGRTNDNGMVDLGSSATMEYVQVNGKRVLENIWLEGTVQIEIT